MQSFEEVGLQVMHASRLLPWHRHDVPGDFGAVSKVKIVSQYARRQRNGGWWEWDVGVGQ